jgi:hypothetical protein
MVSEQPDVERAIVRLAGTDIFRGNIDASEKAATQTGTCGRSYRPRKLEF